MGLERIADEIGDVAERDRMIQKCFDRGLVRRVEHRAGGTALTYDVEREAHRGKSLVIERLELQAAQFIP